MLTPLFVFFQVETLAESGSYEDALSLCAMCKVSYDVFVRGGIRKNYRSPVHVSFCLPSSSCTDDVRLVAVTSLTRWRTFTCALVLIDPSYAQTRRVNIICITYTRLF